MLVTLAAIKRDAEQDVVAFDGKPFNGKTVGEMHGNIQASISTLAGILQAILRDV